MKENIATIDLRNIPISKRIFSAALFAFPFSILIADKFWELPIFTWSEAVFNVWVYYLKLIIIFWGIAIYFAKTVSHQFNITNNTYRRRIHVSMFSIGKWESIGELKYTSVFLNGKGSYEVSIWTDKNEHFKALWFEDQIEAEKSAILIAKELKINFYKK